LFPLTRDFLVLIFKKKKIQREEVKLLGLPKLFDVVLLLQKKSEEEALWQNQKNKKNKK